MIDGYFYGFDDDDLLDFCYDDLDYGDPGALVDDSLSCSAESDQESQPADRKQTGKPVYRKVQQRKAANMRERRRMKSINDAFDNLRACIPADASTERRLSKVDTLRLAIRYINHLSQLVRSCSDHGMDSQYARNSRCQEKVILWCHLADIPDDECFDLDCVGHSLSWADDKIPPKRPGNKFTAKVWIPSTPTNSDLINLAGYGVSEYRR